MAVAVVRDGRVVFAKGYGVQKAGGSDPVTTDTVFQIGSVSKSFTAALAAMEVDSGRMNWNDPVIHYVPDFRMKDPWVTREYTITDSMAQRSGLAGYWGSDLPGFGYNRSEMIHALRYAEPVSGFRSAYAYQSLPFLVTAAAIENTSGRSWEENVQTRIFLPLHMTGASTGYPAFLAMPDRATLHRPGTLPNRTIGPVAIEPDGPFNERTTSIGPAGGINANVKDLATWTIFQMGNGSFEGEQLVSPEGMAYLHTPRTPIGDVMTKNKAYYCQAWRYQEVDGAPSYYYHTGVTLGNNAMVLFVPDGNFGIVVLANAVGTDLPEYLARSFYLRYYGMENSDYGKEIDAGHRKMLEMIRDASPAKKPVRPTNAAPPLAYENYTGIYHDDLYGTATVAGQDGNLTLLLGKKPITLFLSPWNGNTFSAACPQYSPEYDGRVVFGTGPDGTIRQLTTTLFIEQEYHRNATFVRAGG
jgi:CubicO group peptidase (beta-lactamase class C family)